jgi:hypothetical protein
LHPRWNPAVRAGRQVARYVALAEYLWPAECKFEHDDFCQRLRMAAGADVIATAVDGPAGMVHTFIPEPFDGVAMLLVTGPCCVGYD